MKYEDQTFDFFEEVGTTSYDHLETLEPESHQNGLSVDGVNKISDDLMNPMPPADEDL